MIKKILFLALGPLITVGSTYLYKPSIVDCARISHIMYHEQSDLNTVLKEHDLDHYEMVSNTEIAQTGMRISAFRLKGTNNIVIAYRGTQLNNTANLLIDVGIAATALESTDANTYFLQQHAQLWIQKYCNALLGTLNNTTITNYLPTTLALTLLNRWGWNLETAIQYKELAIKDAFDALEKIKQEHRGCTFYITGHSLGGFYAQLIAYHYGHSAYTFNAPGAYQTYRQIHPRWNRALWWIRSKKLITNFVREHDLVGTFGTHLGRTEFIPNKAKPVENVPDEPGYTDTFWLLYDLPTYVRKNHNIAQVVEDLVAREATA